MRLPFSAKSLSLFIVSIIVLAPLGSAYDGCVPDPFCNVRVAISSSNRSHKHAPKDIKKVQAQLTERGIKSQLALSSHGLNVQRRTITDWFLYVYPPDASKARHLVEQAKQHGMHVEPDYTPPTPVGQ